MAGQHKLNPSLLVLHTGFPSQRTLSQREFKSYSIAGLLWMGVGLGGLAHAWIVTVLTSPCQSPQAA